MNPEIRKRFGSGWRIVHSSIRSRRSPTCVSGRLLLYIRVVRENDPLPVGVVDLPRHLRYGRLGARALNRRGCARRLRQLHRGGDLRSGLERPWREHRATGDWSDRFRCRLGTPADTRGIPGQSLMPQTVSGENWHWTDPSIQGFTARLLLPFSTQSCLSSGEASG